MARMDPSAPGKCLPPSNAADRSSAVDASDVAGVFNGTGSLRSLGVLMVILPLLAAVFFLYRSPHNDGIMSFAEDRPFESKSAMISNSDSTGSVNNTVQLLLDGLLVSGFDKGSCVSRYESSFYHKPSPYKPSSYLLSRLRNYEDLHKRCGPNTKSYDHALKQLKTGTSAAPTDCSYVVWVSFSGLGNRMLTIASAFLYALLTDRVLLVDSSTHMDDLFCEPFPNTSWFLSEDFPLMDQFTGFRQQSPRSFGHMLKNNLLNSSSETLLSHLYVHLVHDYDDYDKLFFCDEDQAVLAKVPWVIMKTDNYFVPSLFLMPSFEQELSRLFPEKVAVFHHLGRYLFHPTNQVWGLITRFYNTYMAGADEKIGIQIRVLETTNVALQHVKDQILSCALKQNLLPELHSKETICNSSPAQKSKAVLITSLQSGYYEALRDLYWEHATVTGEKVSFFQPSHEEFQQTGNKKHNRKAWAEIYLLSLTDKVVTSAWSTFGYVAQSLAGLKPWILYKPENKTAPNPPCGRAVSIEPCFHAPPTWDCKAKRATDTGVLGPHIGHCEDVSWGLKLFQGNDET